MSAHVLLNLLNELGKRDQMRGLSCCSVVECLTLDRGATRHCVVGIEQDTFILA